MVMGGGPKKMPGALTLPHKLKDWSSCAASSPHCSCYRATPAPLSLLLAPRLVCVVLVRFGSC